MITNYLTSIWRYVVRNKAFTAINVTGLAMGMIACMLIAQFVTHELGYDRFWKNSERIFRVQQDRYNKGELSTQWAAGCMGIGPDLKADFPEVERYVRMRQSSPVLANGDVFFKEESIYYASRDFFQVFSLSLTEGVDSLALREPYTMVISRSLSRKYFGEESPLGKHLKSNGKVDYVITGVFEDLPENTHMKINALFSFATYAILSNNKDEASLNQWQWDGTLTYILLRENTDAKALEAKLPDYVQKKVGETLKNDNANMVFHLQRVSDIHLDSDFIGEFKANGNRESTYFLSVVAVLILIIAWINYINLSTAKSIERAREVGVRKVMGSFRQQLIQQFLLESFLLNTIAVLTAIVAVLLLTPWFSQLTGRPLDYSLFGQSAFWVSAALLIIGGSVLAGIYPAFVLSSYKPVEVLKGRFKNTHQGVVFRKGMVVVQFMASITLMIGTFVVYQQIQFMRNEKLGIHIDQTLVLRSPNVIADSVYRQTYEAFKQKLTGYAEVIAVSASSSIPGERPGWNAGGIRRLSQREDEANQYRVVMMDHDFIPSYGLEVVAGRAFTAGAPDEEKNVLVNESAVRLLGIDKMELAIDDHIFFWGDTFRVVGVVKNYRQESSKKVVDPLVFRYSPAPGGYYSIKFKAKNVSESIPRFEADWKAFFPGNPFNFFFLDDHYNKQYKADQQFGQVFGLFSALAILIACLGLFGLSSLTAFQRTKEIGVRKVLGASVPGILRLMSKDYLLLLAIAIIFSVPLAWWAMNAWLRDFATHIHLSWWIFALPSALVVFIALFTVSIHILKAARTAPVQSLRYE